MMNTKEQIQMSIKHLEDSIARQSKALDSGYDSSIDAVDKLHEDICTLSYLEDQLNKLTRLEQPFMIYKSIRFNGNSYTIYMLPTDELFISYDIHGEYHEDTVSHADFMFFQIERTLREYLFEGGK